VADFRDAAVAEITRLRAENADLKDRIATALFDKAAVERGVMRLRADLAQRTAERDEARRMYCRAYTDLVVDPRLEELSLEDAAAIVADDLVWDCFDAKEVQR
jgi:hypothetical protein